MSKITTVECFEISLVLKQVNEMMKEGWKLVGPIQFCYDSSSDDDPHDYLATLIKEDDEPRSGIVASSYTENND